MSIRSCAAVLLVALSAIVAACTSLTSRTTIDPGKAFRLSGGQVGAFTVRGTNSRPVPIDAFSELAGKRNSVATLTHRAPVDARFPKGATALYMNASSTRAATFAVKVTGDVAALGMGCEQNPRP